MNTSAPAILEKILANTKVQVDSRKSLTPIKKLEQSVSFTSPTVSLRQYLLRPDLSGIIAEIKKKSPSAGVITSNADIEAISIGYMQAGASALSILTEETFFGGSLQDLQIARLANFCPILRKDFIIDEYQIIEAKSFGADAVLLIVAALTDEELHTYINCAASLGLEVLVEVHDEIEMRRALDTSATLIGINNRNLKTMITDSSTTKLLAPMADNSRLLISESGITSAQTIHELSQNGISGFLIGEAFMKHPYPYKALSALIAELKKLR